MPIHEYLCQDCGKSFELLVGPSGRSARCPHCDSRRLQRQFSVFAAHAGGGVKAEPCLWGAGPAARRGGAPACASGSCPLSQ